MYTYLQTANVILYLGCVSLLINRAIPHPHLRLSLLLGFTLIYFALPSSLLGYLIVITLWFAIINSFQMASLSKYQPVAISVPV